MHRESALTMRGTETISSGITASDNDDALSFGVNRTAFEVTFLDSVCEREEFHRLMNAYELATRNGEISSRCRPARKNDRIEIGTQLIASDVNADIHIASEFDTLGFEL
jgi:hypothetical protein